MGTCGPQRDPYEPLVFTAGSNHSDMPGEVHSCAPSFIDCGSKLAFRLPHVVIRGLTSHSDPRVTTPHTLYAELNVSPAPALWIRRLVVDATAMNGAWIALQSTCHNVQGLIAILIVPPGRAIPGSGFLYSTGDMLVTSVPVQLLMVDLSHADATP